MKSNITPLTRGALFSSLCVLLGLAAVYLPIVGTAATLVFAVPIIVLTRISGVRIGIMASAVSALILALLVHPLIAVRLGIAFLPSGIFIGYAFGKDWSAIRTVCGAIFVSTLAKVLVIAVIFAVTSVNPLETELSLLKESFRTAFQAYESMGMDQGAIDAAKAEIEASLSLVNMLIPMIIFLMGVLDTAINFTVAGKVLRRIDYDAPRLPAFSQWRLPVFFLYLMGFAMVGIYWGSTREIDLLYTVSMNANLLSLFAGLLQGVSIISHVAGRFHLSLIWQALLIMLIMMNGVLAQIVAFVGLFDMAFDYRRRFGIGKH